MTIDELRTAMGPSGTYDPNAWEWTENGWLREITPEQQEIREYLSLVANNKLQSDAITSSEALAYLQEQFDLIINVSGLEARPNVGAFPCEGLDFSNRRFQYVDFSSYTGITVEQILSAHSFDYSTLPSITFTGNESFEGTNLNGTDLSKCTGITATQILSAVITGATLPAIAFTGNESFNGKDIRNTNLSNCTGITAEQILSARELTGTKLPAITFTGNESFNGKGFTSTDLSKCTGITAAQIGSATSVSSMSITSTQYNEWKSTLQTKFKNKYVYVDGVRTRIQ